MPAGLRSIAYIAYNLSTNAPQSGDAANHTLVLIRDGVASLATNSPTEPDATNAPGTYVLQLTATERDAYNIVLAGKSSTANVIIHPVNVILEPNFGLGVTAVDHNYPTTNALQYTDQSGFPIENAQILCYKKSDWDAGNRSVDYVIARSMTDVNGQWRHPIYLDPETYTIVFFKQKEHGPDIATVTVT